MEPNFIYSGGVGNRWSFKVPSNSSLSMNLWFILQINTPREDTLCILDDLATAGSLVEPIYHSPKITATSSEINLQLDIVVWVLQDLWGFPKWQYWAVASAEPTAAANAAAPCPFGCQQTSPRLAKSSPVVGQIRKDRRVKSHQVTIAMWAQPCPVGPLALAQADHSPSLCDWHM